MTILLIEDDTFFQHFYSLKLKEAGFGIEIASNGEEGLVKMRTVRPSLILLDLIMPKKDGFEVLAQKAQYPDLKQIPVVVFSTLGQDQDIAKAMQLGATDYVNKTFFDFENLMEKIKSLVGSPPQTSPVNPPQTISQPTQNSSPSQSSASEIHVSSLANQQIVVNKKT